jgi:cellulose synthase/poly-beta-1,6-N-acetylglucosamine synthase-like glycosyltransferase
LIIVIIYILLGITFLLLIFNLLLYSALNRLFKFRKNIECSTKISVVIAAKNEENNIQSVIQALVEQNYSKENYEVIIVDDNSIDGTYSKANSLCIKFNNFKVIKADNKIYEAKKGAIDIGIKHSKYSHILITDADCVPENNWINSFANEFENNYDFLFGIAPYTKTNSVTNLVTRFENLRAHIIVFSFAKLGIPYSASARSFGFSKRSFNKVGGFKNTTNTLSGDDDLLLQEAIKNNLKIGIITNRNSFVFSNSKEVFSEFVNQKSRHTSTSIYYSLKSKVILAIWHLFNLISLLSIFAFPFGTLFILPFLIKIIIDIFVLNNFQNNFGYKINPILFLFLQINYEINLIYFFLRGLYFSNRWE